MTLRTTIIQYSLHILLIIPLLLGLCSTMRGVNPVTPRLLTLQEVIDRAIQQSPASKYAFNQRENAYWQYRNHKTSFRPSLYLNGNLPDFTSTNSPITQPDGSVSFKNINLSRSSANFSLNQEIAATGTQLFAASDIMRIDDFERNTVAYNSSPFMIGLRQPIFGFNNSRWTKKIEPLRWEESQKGFQEEMEQIAYDACVLFFQLLNVQTDVELARQNLKNSQANLKIAKVKKKLGIISENDFERINLSVYNAKKALSRATMNQKIAAFGLKSYIGTDLLENILLLKPQEIPHLTIDVQKALQQAITNRKETPKLKRLLLEAERDRIRAKRNNGLTANLTATYGLTNTGDNLQNLMDKAEVQKMVKLSFNIPVVDWGRSASRVKMAESRHELIKYEVDQLQQKFEREVVVQAEQFNLLYEQLETSEQADLVAANGYQIALKQYQNGNLSITDLNISLQEREQSRRDYINSLAQFWRAYYKIRILTLYDFEKNMPLIADNPKKD
ncbi:TolC family protein [Puteibacter caeruleilacunae]|nr:TolC family protein [Puteibacter caeruleilacunae]